jgi:predicted ATPase/DNA-binding SARP family transcriptional activator
MESDPTPTCRSGAPAPVLQVRVLGRFDVRIGGVSPPAFRTRTEAHLLGMLVAHYSKPVRREWAACQLWPEAERAGIWLMEALSRVRALLGPHGARIRNLPQSSLQFDHAGAEIDIVAFDEAVRPGAGADCEAAVAAYGGPLLDGWSADWVAAERAAREERFLAAVEQVARGRMETGAGHEALALIRRAVAADPLRESFHALLMDAYSALGDHAAALRAYHAIRRQLLGQNMPVSATLVERAEAARRRARAKAPRVTLPVPGRSEVALDVPCPISPLVGRERDCADLMAALASHRLVTLSGMGGVGKTRLAIEAARRHSAATGRAAAMAHLDGITGGSSGTCECVARAVATLLRAPGDADRPVLEDVIGHLRRRELLLVLDNCEHVLAEATSAVTALLEACPGLIILCTSRVPLGVIGEVVRRIEPLPVPTEAEAAAAVGSGANAEASVALFAERASACDQGFELTAANAPDVVRICRAVEGLPLAIELAAARVRARPLERLVALIETDLGALEGSPALPNRHRSLDALMDWSYAQLEPDERTLLQRMSIFAGGAGLDMLEEVCGEGLAEVSVLVERLVAQSLVMCEVSAPARRFRLHETVRRFAAQRLDPDEADLLEGRRLDHCLRMAREVVARLHGRGEPGALALLEAERANVGHALDFALSYELPPHAGPEMRASGGRGPCRAAASAASKGVMLARTLIPFWDMHGYVREGIACFERAVEAAQQIGDLGLKSDALRGRAAMAMSRGDSRCRTWLTESLTIARAAADIRRMAESLALLARVSEGQADLRAAREYAEEARAAYAVLLDRAGRAEAVGLLGRIAFSERELPRAAELMGEALGIVRELGDTRSEASLLGSMGRVEWARGRRRRAKALIEEAIGILRRDGATRNLAVWLNVAGDMAREERDTLAAVRAYEESLSAFRAQGNARGAAWSLTNLGHALAEDGRSAESLALHREALAVRADLQDLLGIAESLEAIARIVCERPGDWDRQPRRRRGRPRLAEASGGPPSARLAATLYGAAAAVRRTIETPVHTMHLREHERHIRRLRRRLGMLRMQSAWEAGERMPVEEAVERAITDAAPAPPASVGWTRSV